MTTTKNKHANHNLYNNVEKIKAALVDVSQDVKGKAGEILSDSVENIKHRSHLAKNNMAHYTAKKPFKSLGIALLAGLVVGYLLRR